VKVQIGQPRVVVCTQLMFRGMPSALWLLSAREGRRLRSLHHCARGNDVGCANARRDSSCRTNESTIRWRKPGDAMTPSRRALTDSLGGE
jgi:hypothetical protein